MRTTGRRPVRLLTALVLGAALLLLPGRGAGAQDGEEPPGDTTSTTTAPSTTTTTEPSTTTTTTTEPSTTTTTEPSTTTTTTAGSTTTPGTGPGDDDRRDDPPDGPDDDDAGDGAGHGDDDGDDEVRGGAITERARWWACTWCAFDGGGDEAPTSPGGSAARAPARGSGTDGEVAAADGLTLFGASVTDAIPYWPRVEVAPDGERHPLVSRLHEAPTGQRPDRRVGTPSLDGVFEQAGVATLAGVAVSVAVAALGAWLVRRRLAAP